MKTTLERNSDTEEKKAAPSKAARYKDIAVFLLKYGGRELVDRAGLGRFLGEESHENALVSKADQLTQDLENLGPTFVKLGQILSTRSDLLPPETLKQLERLQDKVGPMPYETIEAVVEQELGGKISKMFSMFETEPIGSASLGQVHLATTRSGHVVAVKVQRPDIRPLIETDMEVLTEVAGWLDKNTDLGKRYRFGELISEFEKTLLNELDYEVEAQNLNRLKKALVRFERIIVPSPVPDYCSKKVLTMDYVEGKKISKLSPLARIEVDGEKIADTLVHAYLKQVFVDGFFHADPHPGNIFLVDQEHVALLDLGLVGRFSPMMRKKLLQMLPAIYKADSDEVAEVVLEIADANENVSRTQLARAYADVIDKSRAANLQELGVSQVLFDILRISGEHDVHLPAEITMLGRTLFHLDRIGRLIAPDFNPNASIERHVDSILQQQMFKEATPRTFFKALVEAKDFLETLPRRANRIIDSLLDRRLGFRVDLVPEVHLLENLEKIANRITVGVILASLIIGASQLMQVKTAFTLFGYPGFAMICFLSALLGGIILIFKIARSDQKTQKEASRH